MNLGQSRAADLERPPGGRELDSLANLSQRDRWRSQRLLAQKPANQAIAVRRARA